MVEICVRRGHRGLHLSRAHGVVIRALQLEIRRWRALRTPATAAAAGIVAVHHLDSERVGQGRREQLRLVPGAAQAAAGPVPTPTSPEGGFRVAFPVSSFPASRGAPSRPCPDPSRPPPPSWFHYGGGAMSAGICITSCARLLRSPRSRASVCVDASVAWRAKKATKKRKRSRESKIFSRKKQRWHWPPSAGLAFPRRATQARQNLICF